MKPTPRALLKKKTMKDLAKLPFGLRNRIMQHLAKKIQKTRFKYGY